MFHRIIVRFTLRRGTISAVLDNRLALDKRPSGMQPDPAPALKPDGGRAEDGEATVVIVPSSSYEYGAPPSGRG
jgi:hypothetical protein